MRNSKGQFVAGDSEGPRLGGLALQKRIRAERETLRQLVADVWARRAAAGKGGGYVVALDADLCARIRQALGEGEP